MELIKLIDLFDCSYGTNLALNKLTESDSGIPFISRKENNNGMKTRVEQVDDVAPISGHTLSVALSGSVLATFYQPGKYYTGYHVFVLYPKQDMSPKEMLAYSVVIRANRYKYNYGRQANKTLPDILIPTREEMAKVYAKFDFPDLPRADSTLTAINYSLKPSEWEWVDIANLFNIKGSKTTPLSELEEIGVGSFPYVTTQTENNGVGGFFNRATEIGGVLTIDSAHSGYCSYQLSPFSASDHVEILEPKFEMNSYVAMFLVTVINSEQYRYNYGRKCSQSRLRNAKIKLPVTATGEIDFAFMEGYIQALPYSKNLA